MLGASDPRVAFIGMMSPAILDGLDIVIEQNMALARSGGASEDRVQAIGDYTRAAMPLAVTGDFEELERLTREFYGAVWDDLAPEDQVVAGARDTFVQRQVESVMPTYETDWFRSLLAYDPAPDWERVTVPVLGIFGGKDVQVIAESNEAALREALAAAGNEDVTTLVFPDANHLFQAADTGAVAEYTRLAPEFVDGFVDAVVDWFVQRAGVAA